MRELRPGTVIAAVALFIAIGGTATAASGLINGSKIKPGTVTARQIKNKTITTGKLSPATVKALKGEQGPAGPAGATGSQGAPGQPGADGATGATGVTGAPGAAGVVDPYYAELNDFQLPNGDYTIPLTLNVPAGTYMISAKLNAISHKASGLNLIDCSVWRDEIEAVDQSQIDGEFNQSVGLTLAAVASVQAKLELRCAATDGAGFADNLKLIAVPVQG